MSKISKNPLSYAGPPQAGLLDYKPAKPFLPFIHIMQWINKVILLRQTDVAVSKESLKLFQSIPSGASIIIAPNHADSADPYVAVELSRLLRRPFAYMIARETFDMMHGIAGIILQWMGGFSVVRGGDNAEANRYAKHVLKSGQFPLLIFPEGEIYFLNDRIMPVKPGVALFALDAANEHSKSDGAHPGTFIVPVGIKYHFQKDVTHSMERMLDQIELSVFGRKCCGLPYDRVYSLGVSLIEAKERELNLSSMEAEDIYLRLDRVRKSILMNLENRYFQKEYNGEDLDRARRVIVHLMEMIVEMDHNNERKECMEERLRLNRDLEEGWQAARLVAFADDYLREHPTIERTAETIRKLEREVFHLNIPHQFGKQSAFIRVAPPIDVREYLPQYGERKGRKAAILTLTYRLQEELQKLVDRLSEESNSIR